MADKPKGPEAWTDPTTKKTHVNIGGEKGGTRRPYPLDALKKAVETGEAHERKPKK